MGVGIKCGEPVVLLETVVAGELLVAGEGLGLLLGADEAADDAGAYGVGPGGDAPFPQVFLEIPGSDVGLAPAAPYDLVRGDGVGHGRQSASTPSTLSTAFQMAFRMASSRNSWTWSVL